MTEPTRKRTARKILGREDDSRFRDPLPPWRHAGRTALFCLCFLAGYGLTALIFR